MQRVRRREVLASAVVSLMASSAFVACQAPEGADRTAVEAEPAEPSSTDSDPYVRPSASIPELTSGDTIPGRPSWTSEDWRILETTVRWALDNRVDSLPVGRAMAAIGERFVGTAYVPQTLDPPGDERLVVNLRALDCVTFVENVMALAHFIRGARPGVLEDRDRAMGRYEEILTSIRYRGGVMTGYASRLHYFTEWLGDAEEKGYVRNVTRELGGIADLEPIDFMTRHRDAYRQLADADVFGAIGRIEARLSDRPRYYVPETEVADVQHRIRTGDVIAATSTLQGLDVAHTGIAVRKDGVLRLMHAPLVGEAVQISERGLADRLLAIETQDGVMVARPLDRDRIATGASTESSGSPRP